MPKALIAFMAVVYLAVSIIALVIGDDKSMLRDYIALMWIFAMWLDLKK